MDPMSQTLTTSRPEDPDLPDGDRLDASGRPLPSWRAYGIALIVLGGIGLAAAFTLMVDKVKILQNPDFRPSCDINPVLSCGSVMVTDQASVFGFPNPMLGLIGFSIVVTMGVLYASGVHPPRWMQIGLGGGALAGVVFVHWLAYQSLYEIGALCPWCMVVWAVTLLLSVWTWTLTARELRPDSDVAAVLFDVRFLVVVLWYLGFGIAILVRFWDYWSTLL